MACSLRVFWMRMLSVCRTWTATSPNRLFLVCSRIRWKCESVWCSAKKSKKLLSCWSPQIISSAMLRSDSTTTSLFPS